MARLFRVLWLEDSDDDVEFFNRALRHFPDVSVFRVENGYQGVEYLNGTHPYSDRTQFPLPDFILCDLRMPLMSGLEFIQWLREQPELNHIPVFVLSGSGLRHEAAQAMKDGARDYFAKPSAFAQWRSTIQAFVDAIGQCPSVDRTISVPSDTDSGRV